MVIYKIDRLYEAFMTRAIEKAIEDSQDLQLSKLEEEIAQWEERKKDARCASWQYLNIADKLCSLSTRKTRMRTMQGIDFADSMSSTLNNPIGRIFLDSVPDLSLEQVRQLIQKENWDIQHITLFNSHKPYKSSEKGTEIFGTNKNNGRLLRVYLGELGLRENNLSGGIGDYVKELFGKLNPDLGIILK